MPRLEAPGGVRVMTTGRSGGSDSFSSDALAITTMPVDQLFGHFAEQMRTKGWQALGPVAAQKAMAVQAWQIKQNEVEWRATLITTAMGDNMRDLHIKVVNVTEIAKRRGF